MGRRYYSGDADVYKMKVWMARCTTWYAGTRVTWRVGDALICWHGQNQKPRGLHTPFRIQYDLPDLDPTTWLTHLSYKGSPFKPTSPQNALVLVHSCTTLSKCLDSWHTHLPLLFSSSFPNLFFLYIYPIIHSVYD